MVALGRSTSRGAEAALAASAVPSSFVKLSDRLQQCSDRRLGYFGRHRFVFFYYEPQGHDMVWNDGRSYGFGSGGWLCFDEELAPMAARVGADLGDADRRGRDVLVYDRASGHAYLAERQAAEAFVAAQAALSAA